MLLMEVHEWHEGVQFPQRNYRLAMIAMLLGLLNVPENATVVPIVAVIKITAPSASNLQHNHTSPIDVARLKRRRSPYHRRESSRDHLSSLGCDALDDLPCRQHLAHQTHRHPGVKRQLLDVTYDLRRSSSAGERSNGAPVRN